MTEKEQKNKEDAKKNLTDKLKKKFKNKGVIVSLVSLLFPFVAEREYKRVINRFTKELEKIVNGIEKGIAAGKPKNDVLKDSFGRIMGLGDKLKIQSELGKIANMVGNSQVNQFAKSVKRTFGEKINPKKDLLDEEKKKWIVDNGILLGLLTDTVIKSIKDVGKKPVEEVADNIDKTIQVIENFKNDTPTDQVGNLYSKVGIKIFKTFGIKKYIWKTKRDYRVRECHKSFDGKVFEIDNPPEIWYMTKTGRKYTGRKCHPGQDYNCRCWMVPVFEKGILKKVTEWLD